MPFDDYPVALDELYGCWLWQGFTRNDGYAMTSKRGKMAHRHVYESEGGTIPEGKYLDHLCRRRHCVNPTHLEPVTQSENERRKSWRRRTKRKKCMQGHDMSIHFIVTPEGGKVCRRCARGTL